LSTDNTKLDSKINSDDMCQPNQDDPECYQEDGLLADDYECDADLDSMSMQEKVDKLQYFKQQADNHEFCPKELGQVYPYVKVIETKELTLQKDVLDNTQF